MVVRFIVVVILLGLSSCDRPFSFSPFEAAVPDELRNTTKKNLSKIMAAETVTPDTFKIALLSDAHYHFNDLTDALRKIDKDSSVSFIIVTGDITENGLLKEFELFHSIMRKSVKPYLTVIGNHDHLSNGSHIYEQVYGEGNYSFVFKGIKFVMWDNVLWESNRTPDWAWFKDEVENKVEENESVGRVLPFSHVPPTDGQLKDSARVLHKIFLENQIHLSIHGHKHEFSNEELYGDGIHYVTIGSPDKRYYAELVVTPGSFSVNKIRF